MRSKTHIIVLFVITATTLNNEKANLQSKLDLERLQISRMETELKSKMLSIEDLQRKVIIESERADHNALQLKATENALKNAEKSHLQSHAAYCAHLQLLTSKSGKMTPLEKFRLFTHKALAAHYKIKYNDMLRLYFLQKSTRTDENASIEEMKVRFIFN